MIGTSQTRQRVGAGNLKAHGRRTVRLIAAVQQGVGFGFVLGPKAGLLAGGRVLTVEHFATAKQGVARFHVGCAAS